MVSGSTDVIVLFSSLARSQIEDIVHPILGLELLTPLRPKLLRENPGDLLARANKQNTKAKEHRGGSNNHMPTEPNPS
jgi:hypothetical protein